MDLKTLLKKREEINQLISDEADKKYKIDTSIRFKKGRMQYYQYAYIIGVSAHRGDVKIKILTYETNKEYWIGHYDLHPDDK
jgi:hypothetical protein